MYYLFEFCRMLIGAPLDQNRQPGTNRSGALWQCPMTTHTRDCVQVITDGRISKFPLKFRHQNEIFLRKEDKK